MDIHKIIMSMIVTLLTLLTLVLIFGLLMFKDFSDNHVAKISTKIVQLDCKNSTSGSLRCDSNKDSIVCYKDPESKLYCVVRE